MLLYRELNDPPASLGWVVWVSRPPVADGFFMYAAAGRTHDRKVLHRSLGENGGKIVPHAVVCCLGSMTAIHVGFRLPRGGCVKITWYA